MGGQKQFGEGQPQGVGQVHVALHARQRGVAVHRQARPGVETARGVTDEQPEAVRRNERKLFHRDRETAGEGARLNAPRLAAGVQHVEQGRGRRRDPWRPERGNDA